MAFTRGKKYGQPISTRRIGTCKKARVEVIQVSATLIEEIDMVVPGIDGMFVRTRGVKSKVGNNNGMKPWDLGWADRRHHIRERMGRKDVWDQFYESNEIEAEPHMFMSVPFCSEVELRDLHEDIAYEQQLDAYWSRFDSMLDDDAFDTDDSEILDLMGADSVDAADVCEDIDTWRHSPDLLDNFDDDPGFIGYFN